MASGINLQEFVAGFILEADEHLHSVSRNFVLVSDALKLGRPEPRAVRELFRSFHTIKGLASMVGAGPVVDVAHEMEGILRTADRSGGRLTEGALDLLLSATRAIEERIKAIPKVGVAGIPKAPLHLLDQLVRFQGGGQATASVDTKTELLLPAEILRSLAPSDREHALQSLASSCSLVLIDFEPSPENAAAGLNITSVRERVGKIAELIKVTPHSSVSAPTGIAFYLLISTSHDPQTVAEKIGLPESSTRKVQTSDPALPESIDLESVDDAPETERPVVDQERSSVRVDIRKLDEVLERLSELIVTRSKLTNIAAKLSEKGVDTRELKAIVAENGRQLKRLRAAVTQARMVSLSELLQRLPLVVRGLKKDPAKSVDIFVQAGSAEVDKAVADKVFPAIVHLIRNSVDHAIETKTERSRAGKDSTGVITVQCDDSSGTNLSISIKDDGRGIDREAVARKSGQPLATTDEELLRQICMPGLSTQDDVTQTSGRGMGMDIVRKTIETLGGRITLSTKEGSGTIFKLCVPVSITIVDVLSFVSGGQVFVAPVSMIDEIVEVDPNTLPRSPFIKKTGPQARLLKRRGETIPFLVLESVLKSQADRSIPTRALVVNQLNGAVAFGVDRMLGQQEVVIRPLDESLIRAKGMSGAADLGDGSPTLVLDLASLGAEFAKQSETTQTEVFS